MKIYTTDPNEKKEYIGFAKASIVQARSAVFDITSGLKNIVGGELNSYTDLVEKAQDKAIEKLKEKAKSMGGNAIVCVRFSTSSIMQGAAEITVYGTVVKM